MGLCSEGSGRHGVEGVEGVEVGALCRGDRIVWQLATLCVVRK